MSMILKLCVFYEINNKIDIKCHSFLFYSSVISLHVMSVPTYTECKNHGKIKNVHEVLIPGVAIP